MKTGDIVELKSDGPQMTVSHMVSNSTLGNMWKCVWFDDQNKLCEGLFLERTLFQGDEDSDEDMGEDD